VDAAKPPPGKSWAQGAGRLFAGVAPLQGSIMKQIKSLQTTVQSNSLFENMSSKAMMVRQTATKVVLPVLKTIGHTSQPPIPDPHPEHYCMHLYTHPDKYVVMPPALPAPELHQPARQAIVIDRASVEVECLDVDHAQEMMRGKAKVSIVGLLGIARLQHASYLVVVTGRQVVGYLPHGLVYRVTHTAIRVLGPRSKAGISQVPAPFPPLSSSTIFFQMGAFEHFPAVCTHTQALG